MRDVLDKKVVGVPSSKVDVKDQSQRVGHKYFVIIQLGHVDIQRLAQLASEGLKVMCLTVRGAFMTFIFFSLWDGCRLSGTNICGFNAEIYF